MKAETTFKRIVACRQIVTDALNDAKMDAAKNNHYHFSTAMDKLGLFVLPKREKDSILSILSFCWNREILNNIVMPYNIDGHLYLKWDFIPENYRNLSDLAKLERKKVFTWDFKEGMEA